MITLKIPFQPPKCTYTARAYDHKSGDIDSLIELEFQALPLTPFVSQMKKDMLYQTPCYHKAVDYLCSEGKDIR